MFKTIVFLVLLTFLPLSASAEGFGAASGYTQVRVNDGKLAAELGIGASAQLNQYADVRTIVSSNLDGKDDNVRLNIGLLDLHIPSEKLGVRVGRIQHELGFYTAQLNWAPSRDLYMAPQGIYRENFRYMLRSGDGVQAYARTNIANEILIDAELSYIPKPVFYPMDDITKVWNGVGGTLDQDKSWVRGINIAAEVPRIKTTFRYDQQQLNFKIMQTVPNGMVDGDVNTRGHYFGGKTELSDSIEVIYEYLLVEKFGQTWDKMDVVSKQAGVEFTKDPAKAYGISFGWQVNEMFKLVGGRSAFYTNPADKHGQRMSAMTGAPSYSYYTEDNFLGIKYRMKSWISTLEVHDTKGTATMSLHDSQTKGENNRRVIFTITKILF